MSVLITLNDKEVKMPIFEKFEPKGSKFNDELKQQKLVAVKIHTYQM